MDKFVEYKIVGKYAGQESNHYNTLFQFENTLGCENHACWGSQSADQFEIIVHMTEDVNWGNKESGNFLCNSKTWLSSDKSPKKEPEDCIKSMRWGYYGPNKSPQYSAEDISPCMSWLQKFW